MNCLKTADRVDVIRWIAVNGRNMSQKNSHISLKFAFVICGFTNKEISYGVLNN